MISCSYTTGGFVAAGEGRNGGGIAIYIGTPIRIGGAEKAELVIGLTSSSSSSSSKGFPN
jgi:hypothetical protein